MRRYSDQSTYNAVRIVPNSELDPPALAEARGLDTFLESRDDIARQGLLVVFQGALSLFSVRYGHSRRALGAARVALLPEGRCFVGVSGTREHYSSHRGGVDIRHSKVVFKSVLRMSLGRTTRLLVGVLPMRLNMPHWSLYTVALRKHAWSSEPLCKSNRPESRSSKS